MGKQVPAKLNPPSKCTNQRELDIHNFPSTISLTLSFQLLPIFINVSNLFCKFSAFNTLKKNIFSYLVPRACQISLATDSGNKLYLPPFLQAGENTMDSISWIHKLMQSSLLLCCKTISILLFSLDLSRDLSTLNDSIYIYQGSLHCIALHWTM